MEKVRNIRRLVRGLGSSTSHSRTGFFTALVAFLSSVQDDYPTPTNLFELMDATLSVGEVSNLEKVSKQSNITLNFKCDKNDWFYFPGRFGCIDWPNFSMWRNCSCKQTCQC